MRSVRLDISQIGLNVSDTIKIELVNSVGALYTTSTGYYLSEDILLSNSIFEKELLENDLIDSLTFYKLTLPSSKHLLFRLPSDKSGEVHDLYSLLKSGCFSNIVSETTGELHSRFIKKLDNYFSSQDPHFTELELEIVRLYEYFANNIIDKNYTIDVIRLMDEYLSTIGIKK